MTILLNMKIFMEFMGEAILTFLRMMPLQTDGEGNDMVCTYLIILGVILLILYVSLFIYNRMVVGKKVRQHPCKYCGHMVNAVSHCCGAPVEERFMAGRCSKCGKATRTVCTTCKRELY
jgi:hypothetical protein